MYHITKKNIHQLLDVLDLDLIVDVHHGVHIKKNRTLDTFGKLSAEVPPSLFDTRSVAWSSPNQVTFFLSIYS